MNPEELIAATLRNRPSLDPEKVRERVYEMMREKSVVNRRTQPFSKYLFSYHHDGADWSFEVQAEDEQDAKARVAKMAWAQLDGEVFGTIHVRSSWPARCTVWLLNRLCHGGAGR